MLKRLLMASLLVCLGFSPQLRGQSGGPEVFAQIKAKADKGDAEAQLSLGSLYAAGNGVGRSLSKAAKWHRKAALQGLARAQYQLGLDYAAGEGVKPDQVESVRWFRKAAEQGLAEAQLVLGLAYAKGNGINENAVQAAGWFCKAAEQGLAEGQYEFASCYLDGNGIAKDTVTGIKWLRQAAEGGCASAERRLGLCYHQGDGVQKDNVEAYKWLSLAAGQDDANAPDIRVDLVKVEASLTQEQISQAQTLAREFKPRPPGASGPGPARGTGSSWPNTPPAVEGAQGGTVNVLADNSGSEIYVDGSFVGNSPAKLKLASGLHTVEVKLAGHKEFRRELNVGAGSDLTLRAVLEKQ
jgi:hypothetical protein